MGERLKPVNLSGSDVKSDKVSAGSEPGKNPKAALSEQEVGQQRRQRPLVPGVYPDPTPNRKGPNTLVPGMR